MVWYHCAIKNILWMKTFYKSFGGMCWKLWLNFLFLNKINFRNIFTILKNVIGKNIQIIQDQWQRNPSLCPFIWVVCCSDVDNVCDVMPSSGTRQWQDGFTDMWGRAGQCWGEDGDSYPDVGDLCWGSQSALPITLSYEHIQDISSSFLTTIYIILQCINIKYQMVLFVLSSPYSSAALCCGTQNI